MAMRYAEEKGKYERGYFEVQEVMEELRRRVVEANGKGEREGQGEEGDAFVVKRGMRSRVMMGKVRVAWEEKMRNCGWQEERKEKGKGKGKQSRRREGKKEFIRRLVREREEREYLEQVRKMREEGLI